MNQSPLITWRFASNKTMIWNMQYRTIQERQVWISLSRTLINQTSESFKKKKNVVHWWFPTNLIDTLTPKLKMHLSWRACKRRTKFQAFTSSLCTVQTQTCQQMACSTDNTHDNNQGLGSKGQPSEEQMSSERSEIWERDKESFHRYSWLWGQYDCSLTLAVYIQLPSAFEVVKQVGQKIKKKKMSEQKDRTCR